MTLDVEQGWERALIAAESKWIEQCKVNRELRARLAEMEMTMLDKTTFQYLSPTPEQKSAMETARDAARAYASVLEGLLPEGPDKTYTLRKLREVAMWANVCITRHAEGRPRE